MTLGFSTHWPKEMPDHMACKATFFVEKITKSASKIIGQELDEFIPLNAEKFNYQSKMNFINAVLDNHPKKHTIRADKSNRWKAGNKIHPVINDRTKDRFQFAPVVKCVSVQEIVIKHFSSHIDVEIDGIPYLLEKNSKGRIYIYTGTIEVLAKNDGFDSIHDFFSWFKEDFTGKIIHWTDLKY